MILSLNVKGFKNLREVQIQFGPLTCFVGVNGVGKSNVFDAIQLLRHLADQEIMRAAESVRGPVAGSYSPLDLFWNRDPKQKIEMSVDMLVPLSASDDFGQTVKPTITLLRYEICFGYEAQPIPRLVLERENLVPLRKGDAGGIIGFRHKKSFKDSVVKGRRFGSSFISTKLVDGVARIYLHGDGGSRGRPVPAAHSPRTVLAGTGSADYPTVVAARREMASWKLLHLESSYLRTPDRFSDLSSVDEHGRYMASTLARLEAESGGSGKLLAEAANTLARLVPAVQAIRVDRDETREQLILQVRMKGSNQWHSPRSISDGTLRFLALTVFELDPSTGHVLCMEEPENGIHPEHIGDLVSLLRASTVDPAHPVGAENPSRQVILNTHSPEVAKQLHPEEILLVSAACRGTEQFAVVQPVKCPGQWRHPASYTSMGTILDFASGGSVGESPISSQPSLF